MQSYIVDFNLAIQAVVAFLENSLVFTCSYGCTKKS